MTNGKDRPQRPSPARNKLDPRLAAILSLPQAELRMTAEREHKMIEIEFDKLRREVQSRPTPPDDSAGDERSGHIAGVSRELRARRMQYARLTHGIDLSVPDPVASVFIKFRGDPERFSEYGIQVRSVAGDILTANVPLSAIPRLERDEDVLFIELSRPAFPDLDQSVPITEADVLHTAPAPITGQGTIVGIVDYGLDFYHPDFRDASDDTRVLCLWTQTSGPGPAPAPWGYGTEYSQANIDADLASGTPYSVVNHQAGVAAHGTHVAGIAAGNGRGDGVRVGMAPDAEIIFVDTIGSGVLALADMADLADAIDYCFTRAGATPCVVNLSLGDNLGPHDGTSLVEQFIDNLLALPARAVTIAAGNSNAQTKHARGNVPNGGTETVTFNMPADTNRGESLEIWYDGHDRFDFTITPPGLAAIGPINPGAGPTVVITPTCRVTVTSVVNDPRNGDNVISVVIEPLGGNLPAGAWTILLDGSSGGGPSVVNGLWHAWIDRNTWAGWTAATFNELTLNTPGTSRLAVTVANHAKPGAQVLQNTSGRGPTRDGRIKPEVSAPGALIVAPRSRNMNLADPGALYTTMGGTSMAAPHVAGAIALMFQCRGGMLTSADAKYIMQRLADTTGIATVPDVGYGWGRLRVGNSCAWAIDGPDVWLRCNPADTGAEPLTGPSYTSPDIWIRPNRDGGATHENPEFGQENHVHVLVRNRGTGPAFNTQAYLYWADPATSIPFSAWQTAGIRVGLAETNVQVLPELAPGAAVQTPLPFSWFPPAPGTSMHGDNHFCLLVRLESENDPSGVGPGGWSSIRDHNNLAVKNVHIVDLQPDETDATDAFLIRGAHGRNALWIDATKLPARARVTLQLPIQALDITALPVLTPEIRKRLVQLQTAVPDERDRQAAETVRLLQPLKPSVKAWQKLSSIRGVVGAGFVGDSIRLRLTEPMAFLDRLPLVPAATTPVRLSVTGLVGDLGPECMVNIEQWVDGNQVGGVALLFRRRSVKPKIPGIRKSPLYDLILRK